MTLTRKFVVYCLGTLVGRFFFTTIVYPVMVRGRKIVAYGVGISVGTLFFGTIFGLVTAQGPVELLSRQGFVLIGSAGMAIAFGVCATYKLLHPQISIIELPPRPGASRPRTFLCVPKGHHSPSKILSIDSRS